jgi:glycosyltransferase involved in cell wall biosynthesis
MVLPRNERFSQDAGGAISIVVRYLAEAGDALVLGMPVAFPVPGLRFQPVGRRLAATAMGYRLGVVLAVRRLQPQFVDVHQQPLLARVLARLCPGCRVSLVLHNDPLRMRELKTVGKRRATLRLMFQVIAVSADLARRYMVGLCASEGAPVVQVNPINLSCQPSCLEKRQEFIFVGRVTPDKGVDLFIEACSRVLPRLPGWSARIVGGERFGLGQVATPFVKTMREAAAAAGVECTGYMPHAQVLQALAEAAIAVMPSRMIEGFPLTAMEALANGAALVATRQGGLPEAAGEAAMYVPTGDVEALAEAMLALATDAPARARLAEAGLARVRQFDLPVVAQSWARMRQSAG